MSTPLTNEVVSMCGGPVSLGYTDYRHPHAVIMNRCEMVRLALLLLRATFRYAHASVFISNESRELLPALDVSEKAQ